MTWHGLFNGELNSPFNGKLNSQFNATFACFQLSGNFFLTLSACYCGSGYHVCVLEQ